MARLRSKLGWRSGHRQCSAARGGGEHGVLRILVRRGGAGQWMAGARRAVEAIGEAGSAAAAPMADGDALGDREMAGVHEGRLAVSNRRLPLPLKARRVPRQGPGARGTQDRPVDAASRARRGAVERWHALAQASRRLGASTTSTCVASGHAARSGPGRREGQGRHAARRRSTASRSRAPVAVWTPVNTCLTALFSKNLNRSALKCK
jgi:hypothetical protein